MGGGLLCEIWLQRESLIQKGTGDAYILVFNWKGVVLKKIAVVVYMGGLLVKLGLMQIFFKGRAG